MNWKPNGLVARIVHRVSQNALPRAALNSSAKSRRFKVNKGPLVQEFYLGPLMQQATATPAAVVEPAGNPAGRYTVEGPSS